MVKLDLSTFEELVASAKSSIGEAGSPILKRARDSVKEKASKAVANMKAKLTFDMLDPDTLTVKKTSAGTRNGGNKVPSTNPLIIDYEEPDKNIPVVLNWLMKFVKGMMKQINDMGEFITFVNQRVEDISVPRSKEVEVLSGRVSSLEDDTEDLRQRLLKGNLIISSPNRKDKDGRNIPSLAVPDRIRESGTNTFRMETELEMVLRLIKEKSGVEIPTSDIMAFHQLGSGRTGTSTPTSFILRINNRKPASAWDMLTTAMMKGELSYDKNIFINFQLTPRKSELARQIRKAKKEKKIRKFYIDPNGKISVRSSDTSPKTEIKSLSALTAFLSK